MKQGEGKRISKNYEGQRGRGSMSHTIRIQLYRNATYIHVGSFSNLVCDAVSLWEGHLDVIKPVAYGNILHNVTGMNHICGDHKYHHAVYHTTAIKKFP